jgi:hypothetical protein
MIFRSRPFLSGQSVAPIARIGLLSAAVLAGPATTVFGQSFIQEPPQTANEVEISSPSAESSPFLQASAAGWSTGPSLGATEAVSGVEAAHQWAPMPAEGDVSADGDTDILLTGFGSQAHHQTNHSIAEKSLPGAIQEMIDYHRQSGACWIGRAETILLWRNAPRSRPIISAYDPVTGVGPAVIDADSMESTLAGGPRISLLRYNPAGEAIEFSYLRAFNFRSQAATPPSSAAYTLLPDGIFGNTFPPPNPPLDAATANLGAGVQGMEFNRRLPWTQNISLLGGLRWVEWRESFSLNTSTTDGGLGRLDDYYGMDTINSMYGLQIGADGRVMTPFSWLRIDGLVKAGYYYNIAVQNSAIQFGGTTPYTDSLRADSTFPGFVGEVGLTGTIPLTSWLDFQLGYMGLWLEGIAQPTNLLSDQSLTQINPPPPTGSISATGGTVLQGVTFGLQGRW